MVFPLTLGNFPAFPFLALTVAGTEEGSFGKENLLFTRVHGQIACWRRKFACVDESLES